MPRERRERDAKEPDTMKEEGGIDFSVRSRKRKANVAVDPDEEIAKIDRTARGQCGGQEIYPPKLHQFAYVTDGACSGDEILTMELMIMKALNWRLSPLTIVSWLNVYMQVAYLNDIYEVLLPQYPQQIFIQIAELLDLCVLDIGCSEFPYGILAASALYHFSSSELMQKVSGYQWCEIEQCVKWMVPFAMVIRETGSSKLKHFRGVPAEDAHNIQTHLNSLDLLDKAQAKKAILSEQNRISPLPSGVLTPPQSSKKQNGGQGMA
ncbi:G1/S-specific cyclin-E1 [Tupaia chinensis]|uniref:G1/S-specific cyclin-E1 n=1 Tax=Tupaia chinensis TaxID=246437 RepID=L8Y3H4_TUPCH|nr:G1/S-specific cyclin-E1 [Tupaia chinensis]